MGPTGRCRIVAVQHVHVDETGSHALQRLVQVAGDVLRGHALTAIVRVRTLAQDHHLVANATVGDPRTEHALAGSPAITVRGVEGAAAMLVDGVEEGQASRQVVLPQWHRPLDEP